VDPTSDDVDQLVRRAAASNASIVIHAVRYSWAELNDFSERAPGFALGDSFVEMGPSPVTNKVELELNKADPDLVDRIKRYVRTY